MTKHNNSLPRHNNLTTIFGYTLFAVTVLAFVLTIAIPLGSSLQHATTTYFNTIVIIFVFGIMAILPALASYIIGDKATHTKNKSLHHYNGVLFGIVAYWVASLFNWIGFSMAGFVSYPYPVPLVVNYVIPVILTIALMAVVAFNYAKKQESNSSVLQYRPFQLILIASVLIGFVYPHLSDSFTYAGSFVSAIGTFAIPLIATAIAYMVLAKYQTSKLARLSDAIVAMSFGIIAVLLASSFMAYMQLIQAEVAFGYAVGLAVFAAYLYLRTRKK